MVQWDSVRFKKRILVYLILWWLKTCRYWIFADLPIFDLCRYADISWWNLMYIALPLLYSFMNIDTAVTFDTSSLVIILSIVLKRASQTSKTTPVQRRDMLPRPSSVLNRGVGCITFRVKQILLPIFCRYDIKCRYPNIGIKIVCRYADIISACLYSRLLVLQMASAWTLLDRMKKSEKQYKRHKLNITIFSWLGCPSRTKVLVQPSALHQSWPWPWPEQLKNFFRDFATFGSFRVGKIRKKSVSYSGQGLTLVQTRRLNSKLLIWMDTLQWTNGPT